MLAVSVMASAAGWQRSGGTVIDTAGKRQWQDSRPAEEKDTVWRDARGYCANLQLEGFADWRLPTRAELERLRQAALSGEVTLKHAAQSAYWTSEVYRKLPINVWALYWVNGHTFDSDRCDEAHVRCVRER
jgi:formylglycine-generating enzyme required for sulfatase activity